MELTEQEREIKKRLANVWSGMRERCLNTKSNNYPSYGGRGKKRNIGEYSNLIETKLAFDTFMRALGKAEERMLNFTDAEYYMHLLERIRCQRMSKRLVAEELGVDVIDEIGSTWF